MHFKFNVRPKDIPLLTRALQSLESAPDSWFEDMSPADIQLVKNAARGFPAKIRFHLPNISYAEFFAFNASCDYLLETGRLSSREQDILEHYSDMSCSILDEFADSLPDM